MRSKSIFLALLFLAPVLALAEADTADTIKTVYGNPTRCLGVATQKNIFDQFRRSVTPQIYKDTKNSLIHFYKSKLGISISDSDIQLTLHIGNSGWIDQNPYSHGLPFLTEADIYILGKVSAGKDSLNFKASPSQNIQFRVELDQNTSIDVLGRNVGSANICIVSTSYDLSNFAVTDDAIETGSLYNWEVVNTESGNSLPDLEFSSSIDRVAQIRVSIP